MTEAEYKSMKAQLRAEILEELKAPALPRPPKPWTKVRRSWERKTKHLLPQKEYRLRAAFCETIRHRYQLENVLKMSEDQVTETLTIISDFLALAGIPEM